MKNRILAEITKLKREGALLLKRIEEYAEELRHDGRQISALKATRLWGWIYTGTGVLLLIATFYLNYVTFSGLGFASMELAIGISIATFVLFERCITCFSKWYWDGSQKHFTGFALSSLFLIPLVAAQILLGYIRGGFVEEVSFIKPGILSFLFPIFTIVCEFAGAFACHEGLSALISVARPLRLHQKIRKGEEKAIQIAFEIEKLEGELESYNEPERKARERKALLVKIFIVLLIVLGALAFAGVSMAASKAECRVILLDMSLSSDAKDRSERGTEFEKNLGTVLSIIRQQEKSGRVVVAGITDESFSRPLIVLDRQLPESGLLGEKLEFDKRKVAKEFQIATKDLKPFSSKTDIFGALSLTKDLFGQSCQDKKLYILSDMRHAARGIDIENVSLVSQAAVANAERGGMLPRLDGVKVVVGGVHTIGKDERYIESLRRFWEAYFKKAGADLQGFSTIR